MKFTCQRCRRDVDETEHAQYFNYVFGHRSVKIAEQFADSCLCPRCWDTRNLEITVEGLCANFTGLHTRIDTIHQKVAKLEAALRNLEDKWSD